MGSKFKVGSFVGGTMGRLSYGKKRLETGNYARVKPAEKQVLEHYQTPDHRAWRQAIFERFHGCCAVCGRYEKRMFADHIVELKDGGSPFDVSNGQLLCGSHHTIKTNAEKAKRAERAGAG